MEREKGFEPSTSTLARLHSTTELLPHSCLTKGLYGHSLYFHRWVCQILIFKKLGFGSGHYALDILMMFEEYQECDNEGDGDIREGHF